MKKIVATLALALIVAMVVGCVETEPTPTPTPTPIDNNKYIFLEVWSHNTGEVIEGEQVRGPMVDFPTYWFDENTGIMNGIVNFDVNNTLLVVLGRGQSLSGAAGGGAASSLTGIYAVPHSSGKLKITSLGSDGTVSLIYNGTSIVLEPGEKWEDAVVSIEDFLGSKVKFTTTITIRNYGVLDKAEIKPWNETMSP